MANVRESSEGRHLDAAICHIATPIRRGEISAKEGLLVHKNAGFFRASFAGGRRCASFETWTLSFAKLAASRVELWWGASCVLPAKARS